MSLDLSFRLHLLTARLDRAADRLLQEEHDISYRRFLALTLVGELGIATQRELAEALGVTEASVSRMTSVLAAEGLLDVSSEPGTGNRRRLALSPRGEELTAGGRAFLEGRFEELVAHSGADYARLADEVDLLLATLDGRAE
jgi:DNA-binding MarR family transcriptional regulator